MHSTTVHSSSHDFMRARARGFSRHWTPAKKKRSLLRNANIRVHIYVFERNSVLAAATQLHYREEEKRARWKRLIKKIERHLRPTLARLQRVCLQCSNWSKPAGVSASLTTDRPCDQVERTLQETSLFQVFCILIESFEGLLTLVDFRWTLDIRLQCFHIVDSQELM